MYNRIKLALVASLWAGLALGMVSTSAIAQPIQPLPPPLTPLEDLPSQQAEVSESEYGLLIRAIHQLLSRDRLLLESKLTMSATAPGGKVEFLAQVQTLTAGPRQFRTQIEFIDPAPSLNPSAAVDNRVNKKFLLVSDGRRVWVHNLTLNTYFVTPYEQFEASSDNFVTGMILRLLGAFRQGAGEETVAAWVAMPIDNLIQLIEASLPAQPFGLNRSSQRLGQTEYTTYGYADPQQKFNVVAFIHPQTAEIEQLQLSSDSPQSQVALQETVTRQEVPQTIPAGTFRFIPPPGATLSKKPFSLDPF